MHLRSLVPSLLLLASLASTAETMSGLAWSGAPGAKPPAGWSVSAAPGSSVEFLERAIELSVPPSKQALAVAAVGLPDGSDEQPLRLSALVSASGKGALDGYPALVALEWAGGAVFAVGLGNDPHTKKDERRAWAVWSGNGVSGSDHAESELAAGESPAHLRLVLTARDVAAYGSSDGWSWTRIAGVRRAALGASGAPARVVVGRGQARTGAAGLAADPPADAKLPACRYRFAELRVEAGKAEVPAAALKSYVKKDSLSDTVDALAATGMVRSWRLRGPEAAAGMVMPVQLPAGFTTSADWKGHQFAEGERFLPLTKLLPPANSLQVRWAATTVTTAEPGWLRFRFDGMSACWLWVAGRLVHAPVREVAETEPDRLSASAWLPAGSHGVVLAVRSHVHGTAILRHEPGDPRARIALLRRLAIDFPGDELLLDAPFEIARLWEGLGFAGEAAKALDELANANADPDLAERALGERARLYHQLGDEAAATAATTALQQLWSAQATDAVTAARRAARLWQRLDAPDRALGILSDALQTPGLDGPTRCALTVDRARLQRSRGDEAAVAGELRAAAGLLPAGDAARFDLLVAAARLDPAKPALEALAAQATDALRARQLAGVHAARKDEIARLAARRAAANLRGTQLAMPAIELAEDLAAAKDEPGALKQYRIELTRRGLPAATDLSAARTALVRAVLAETSAGAALLAEAAVVPQDAVGLVQWQVRGPVPQGDWTPHERPAFDLTQAPTGKEWKAVQPKFWNAGILDFAQLGGGDGVVWYMATTIASDKACSITASFGADDALSVWLNGARLYSDRIQRGLTPDSIVLSLPLRQGVNVLVCSVQNGGGPAGFQFRTRREPWPASDLASVIAGAATDRTATAKTLTELAGTLATAERTDEAWALARAVIACFPEHFNISRDLAVRVMSQPVWRAPPTARLELLAWFEAMLADRRWDDAETRRWLRESVPGLLLQAGLVEEALARLRRQTLTELDPLLVAGAGLREADLWLGLGFPSAAAAAVQRARDAAPGEEAIDREADRRRRPIAARRKFERITLVPPFELAAQVRTAERSMDSDPERAAKDLQAVIENAGGQPLGLAGGRITGAAAFAARRLRSAPPAVQQVWQEANAARASAALARLTGDDPQDLTALAARHPLAAAAGEALRREADLWAARGAWMLASGTALRALAEHPGADRQHLLLRAAHAAARLGDVAGLDGLLARLAKAGKALPWDGRQLPPDQLAAQLRGLLAPAAEVAPAGFGLSVQLGRQAPAMRAMMLADARPPLPAVALVGDALVVAGPDLVAAVAPDGRLRWRHSLDHEGNSRSPAFAAGGEATLAVDGGVVIAGLRRSGGRRLVAVEAASGRRLWSSGDAPELWRASVASAPTASGGRVWAWFVETSRSFVACLDARSGAVLWRTDLGTGDVRLPLLTGGDLVLAGNAAAPALAGRELFVSTDAGQVGAFDAVDGRLLWVHLYARTTFDPAEARIALRRLMARGRGRILVDAERVYFAPRDSLGILALTRSGGAAAWSAELADVHELSALAPAGLVALGPAVSLYHPATGALRLRWRPASGELPGRPALAGNGLWIPLRYGPLRLDLGDGGIRQGPAWSALGLGEPASGLQVEDGRLLALADGLVATPVAGAAKPVVATVTSRAEPRASAAVSAGLALRWELPLGRPALLHAAGEGESYCIAADRLHRLDPASGRIAWSAPAPGSGLRGITVDGPAVLVESDCLVALYDRATGRLLWQEPVGRDPLVNGPAWDRWRNRVRLDGDAVLQWTDSDSRFRVRAAGDGRVRLAGTANHPLRGLLISGQHLHLLTVHERKALIEIRQLADGRLVREVPLGIAGIERASFTRVPGDPATALVASTNGGMLWNLEKGEGRRFDLNLVWVDQLRREGNLLAIAGQSETRNSGAIIDLAAGRTLYQDHFVTYTHNPWHARAAWAPQLVAGLRVQALPYRNYSTGVTVATPAGDEKAWLPVMQHAAPHHTLGLVPLGGRALFLSSFQDGWFRVHDIDPTAGKIVGEARFALGVVPEMPPIRGGGGVLVPTLGGLASIVPVDGPEPTRQADGHMLADLPQPIWRLPKPLEIDGHLAAWQDQAGWTTAAPAPCSAWAGWNDQGFAFALRQPMPGPQESGTVVAIEPVRDAFDSQTAPLLLRLEWQGGRGQVRVLERSRTSPQLLSRAASDGTSLAWEVLVPWEWLLGDEERPRKDMHLRWGLRAGDAEFGRGLSPVLDKAGLMRLHLHDAKPAPPAVEKPGK